MNDEHNPQYFYAGREVRLDVRMVGRWIHFDMQSAGSTSFGLERF